MDTLQKALSAVLRELRDEELDLVGGLTGTNGGTKETWTWTRLETGAAPPAPAYVYVPDEVTTVPIPD
jgi:hypothetical protein